MLTINSSKVSAVAVSRIFSVHKLPFMASRKKYRRRQKQWKPSYGGVPQRKGSKGHLIPHTKKHSSQLPIPHAMAANTKNNWTTDHQLSCWDLATTLYLDIFNRPTIATVFLTKSGPPFLKEGTSEQHRHAAELVLVVKPEAFQTPQGTLNQQLCNSSKTPSHTRQACLIT